MTTKTIQFNGYTIQISDEDDSSSLDNSTSYITTYWQDGYLIKVFTTNTKEDDVEEPPFMQDLYETIAKVITSLSNKQDTLVSGTNIKTINNYSILGSGNLNFSGGGYLPDYTGLGGRYLYTDGIVATWEKVDALPSQSGYSGLYLTTNGTEASWSSLNLSNYNINALGDVEVNSATEGQVLMFTGQGWENKTFVSTDTKVTNTLSKTSKAYITGTTTPITNTGTQVFDTGVYLSNISGNLVASTFTGRLQGNADTATITSNVSGEIGNRDIDRHVWFSNSSSETSRCYDDNFCYNPFYGSLTAASFIGDLTGNADTATTLIDLTSTIDELNFVSGVTSNIQEQLDDKLDSEDIIISQTLQSGIEIGEITVGENSTKLYCTNSQNVSVSQTLQSGIEIAEITVGETSTKLYCVEGDVYYPGEGINILSNVISTNNIVFREWS